MSRKRELFFCDNERSINILCIVSFS